MPHSPTDPRYAALLTRCWSIKVELDRLDDILMLLARDERARFDARANVLRDALDGLERDVEARVAGR